MRETDAAVPPAGSAPASSGQPAGPVRVAVDGVEIPEAAILAEMQYHPATSVAEAWRQAAEALVVRTLLVNECVRLGLPESEEISSGEAGEDPRIAALIAQEVVTPEPDDETCRRYHRNNARRFRSPALYEARHILLAASPDDGDARMQARSRAGELIAHLQAEPEAFGALARAHSDCPSKTADGNLGQIEQGSTVPEFETFLFSLEEGELCPQPVETRYGIHVVQMCRRISGCDLPYEAVRDKVAAHLREASFVTAVRQYLSLLAGRADIDGVTLSGTTSPLVQ